MSNKVLDPITIAQWILDICRDARAANHTTGVVELSVENAKALASYTIAMQDACERLHDNPELDDESRLRLINEDIAAVEDR